MFLAIVKLLFPSLTITLTSDDLVSKEITIEVEKKNFESAEREIQLCLNGSYTYANIKDATGNSHYLTIGFLKNSYITISDDDASKDADTLK